MTAKSLYEQLFPLTTVMKQRVVDNFDGDSLNERWTTTIEGSGTIAMADEIDGGLQIQSGTVGNEASSIHFNNIRHYDNQNSIAIFAMRAVAGDSRFMLVNSAGQEGGVQLIMISHRPAVFTNFRFFTADAGLTQISTGVVNDTNPHSIKLQLTSSDGKGIIDRILVATNTTNLPTTRLQPQVMARRTDTVQADLRVLYCEAYNI